MTTRKKLIEVALPLEKINVASAREKSIRHGHPSTLHLWWARRPLAAARAVIFAQMVDDPAGYVDELLSDPGKLIQAQRDLLDRHTAWEQRKRAHEDGDSGAADPGPAPTLDECAAELERQRLFRLIEQLVLWENTTNEGVLQQARDEIWRSWRRTCAENKGHLRAAELFDPEKLPAFHDPFAGGGAIPLEAQRLGLESYASDLNPVAVLINKAMIEIPPKFAGMPPVNPKARKGRMALGQQWKGAQGLAEDVRYYGQWMRDEAEKRIGHLYPKVEVTAAMAQERPDLKPYVGKQLTVVAWLWARTVKSPNPAFRNVDVPLASTFMLSTKAGKETYVEPVVERDRYRFTVKVGKPKDAEAAKKGTRAGKAQDFLCLLSGVPITRDYVRDEGKAGRLGERLMAIVAEGDRGRVYLPPTEIDDACARQAAKDPMVDEARTTFMSGLTPTRAMITGGVCSAYGLSTWGHIFTPRQIVALNTFADLVSDAREHVRRDALDAGLDDDKRGLEDGGKGSVAYAEAVGVYLAFAISKLADRGSTICTWFTERDSTRNTFARQNIPMTWDYAEPNTLLNGTGSFAGAIDWTAESIEGVVAGYSHSAGIGSQGNACTQRISQDKIISTDPPYYDNIGYADLSDFFYVWLRRTLRPTFPELFATLAVPKTEELVAIPYRHGGKDKAEKFFLDGMTQAMGRLAEQSHPAFPVTIYYAFKQVENNGIDGTTSTGWETFIDAVIRAGFAISGTWPMRTELSNRMIGSGTNALASSIVLVCRPHPQNAPTITRRDFVAALKAELPRALRLLQAGNIAPVDLAQASIGPGMAVFTRYGKVIDASGKALRVREALALINQTLDEVLAEQEGDFDAETRWAVTWFEQQGFSEGEYGVAETLATARNVSVKGMSESGILVMKGGKVRLLKPEELPADWNPDLDGRLTVWEMVHHLVRVLNHSEASAGELLAKLGARADGARELAYRLYAVCERKKRASEALTYNGLVQSWPQMLLLAGEQHDTTPTQQGLGL